jgi:hypothetical protein
MKLNLVIEKLEKRIAPGGINTGCSDGGSNDECGHKEHGNNGFGNGGDDGVPGNSGKEDCNR